MSERVARAAGSVLIAVATAVVIVLVAILPFLTPAWISFAQDRAEATAWTGYSPSEVRTATDVILGDLLFAAGDFAVQIDGQPVLTEAERGHMRDVRGVFRTFAVVGLLAALTLVAAAVVTRLSPTVWRSVRAGAVGLAIGVVGLGGVAAVAFETGFEAFHRLFFAGGNYTFDPATDRLVQLFPQRFWFETSIALGGVIVLLAVATALLVSRHIRAEAARPAVGAPARLEHAR